MAASYNERRLELKDVLTLRRLGQGHSGYLYETEWGGKKYARKDFPLGSVELNRLFESEVQPLFDLDHPNIVKCFGYTLGKSSCSLVQEYVEENLQNTIQSRIEEQRKKSLRSTSTSTRVFDVDEIKRLVSSRSKKKETATTDEGSSRCRRPTPFEGPEAIAIISQIATGMKYLHDNQVVHGDLKPRNVLLYSESGERKVKLADFGLSETKEKITSVSERSRHLEKLTWKAPECLEEEVLGSSIVDSDEEGYKSEIDAAVDNYRPKADAVEEVGRVRTAYDFLESRLAKSDVYSFGLICKYILGGKLPYPDVSLTKFQERRMLQGFRSKLPPECPKHLKLMIDVCLKFIPSSRPTFTIICAALQPYLTVPMKTTAETGLQSAITEKSLRVEVTEASLRSVSKKPDKRFEQYLNDGDKGQRPRNSKFFGVLDVSGTSRGQKRPWSVDLRVEDEGGAIWCGSYNTPEAAGRAADAVNYYYDRPDNLNFRDSPQFLKPIPENLSSRRKRYFVKKEARWLAGLTEMLPSTWDPDNRTFCSPRLSSGNDSVQISNSMEIFDAHLGPIDNVLDHINPSSEVDKFNQKISKEVRKISYGSPRDPPHVCKSYPCIVCGGR